MKQLSKFSLIVFVCIMTICANAKPITYKETFDKVKVISPAKSKKLECKTRVDLDKGLIDNRGCDVKQIDVYNADGMWVGALPGIDAYYSMKYADYDSDRYVGSGIKIVVTYNVESERASNTNKWAIACPKNMIAYIDEYNYEYWSCKIAHDCPNGMYAVNAIQCKELPANAHRNKMIGFTCDNNYVMHDGQCEEKAVCNENSRYVVYENTCVDLPVNAVWEDSSSLIWKCKDGYLHYKGVCEVKPTCLQEQRYDANLNLCFDKPANSSWIDNSTDYVCDSGYVDLGYGQCEEKPLCLHNNARYNAINNSCYEKPENSLWSDSYGIAWVCDSGYWNDGFSCIKKAACDFHERYDFENNKCITKPEHSSWVNPVGTDWACDAGYRADTYDKCIETNPILLEDYFGLSHDIGFDIGGGTIRVLDGNWEFMTNFGIDYNIGFRMGSKNVGTRIQGTVGLLLTNFDYAAPERTDLSEEHIFSVILLCGMNVGFDLYRFVFDYSWLLTKQELLDNIEFNSPIHKIRMGIKLNDTWNLYLSIIPRLIDSAVIVKNSHNTTCYHLGFTYRF